MSPESARPRPRSRRFGTDFEEERTWVTFYRRVGHDVALAGEMLAQLEADTEMKRDHLALYLCCKESLRNHKARQARNKRVRKLPRQVDKSEVETSWLNTLGLNTAGGTLPSDSCGRNSL